MFCYLAQMFLAHRVGKIPRQGTLVYPSKGKKDHAHQWAQSLAALCGYSTVALRLLSKEKQALKSLGGRDRVDFTSRKIRGSVFFVDDILTSGGTARAAFRALGKPKSFQIWTVFYRREL